MQPMPLSRRSFSKFVLFTGLSLAAPTWLLGCSDGRDQKPLESDRGLPDESDADTQDGTSARKVIKGFEAPILVAYYSATGNTRKAAEAVAETLTATLWAITPEDPYTPADLDYNDPESRVSRERAADGADTMVPLDEDRPPDFASYRTVFIGYPIWFGDASWVVNAFIGHNKFSGKTVVPFCTSASSPLGSSASNLAQRCKSGVWLAGTRFDAAVNTRAVEQWVESIGYNH